MIPAAVLGGVLATAAAGWLVLIQRMPGMDTGPGGDPGMLGWFAVTWAVMTVGMMLPASAPAAVRLAHGWRSRTAAAVVLFLCGYVLVWMLAGLVGFAFIQAVRGLHPTVLGWPHGGRYIAGASIAATALYQLTASKRRWLARCTSPHIGVPSAGLGTAVRAGADHGGCCVACCWTMMVALYALGMMSLVWMAVLTALIVAERTLGRQVLAVRAVAAVLIVLGVALMVRPTAVPALTIPSTGGPMTAMTAGA
ncbi:MAG: DUF2182 domain-containing protein [Solirubrobacteraceae bacterium]